MKPSNHLIYLDQARGPRANLLLLATLLWDRRCLEPGHSHRTVKIKTFRPEISTVDIMIAKVSSCLLPVGGDGDDECDVMKCWVSGAAEHPLQHCSTAALSFYHICIHPTSVITDWSKFAHSLPVPCWWQWRNSWTSNHLLLTLLSLLTPPSPVRKQSCVSWTVILSHLQPLHATVRVSTIQWYQLSGMRSENLHLRYHQQSQMIYHHLELNLAEKPTILVIKSVQGIWQVSREE